MNTTDKGTVLELYVMTILFEIGYQMAMPFGTQSGWDLLCWKDGKFQRIQVKTARIRGKNKDRVCVDFLRSKDRTKNKKTEEWSYKGYSPKEVDYIFAVEKTSKKIWILPIDITKYKRSISFGLNEYVFDW